MTKEEYQKILEARDISGGYSVIFKGFKSMDDAKEFANWFEGAGEDDADYWMTDHGVYSYYTGTTVKDVELDNSYIVQLFASGRNN